jgi:hypothetical protein
LRGSAPHTCPTPRRGAQLGLWTTFTDQRAPLAYDIFTVYNITNPWDVLYRGALPVVQEVGPFVYQRVETRELVAPSPSAPANEVQFRTRVQLLKTTSTVLLLNRSGGYEAIQPKDADDNLVYMFNPTLLFLAAQLQLNPLNEEAFQGFYARCAAAHGGGRPSIEWCIDRALQTASGGAASLNTSYSGSQQGLIPLRSVSQWLGVQGVQVPEDALWANVNQFIRNDTETCKHATRPLRRRCALTRSAAPTPLFAPSRPRRLGRWLGLFYQLHATCAAGARGRAAGGGARFRPPRSAAGHDLHAVERRACAPGRGRDKEREPVEHPRLWARVCGLGRGGEHCGGALLRLAADAPEHGSRGSTGREHLVVAAHSAAALLCRWRRAVFAARCRAEPLRV